jgi:hypothetical protein
MYKGEDRGTTVKESSRPACSKTRRVVSSKSFVPLCSSSVSSFSSNALSLFSLGFAVLSLLVCCGGSVGSVGLENHRFGLYRDVDEFVVGCSDQYQFSDAVPFAVRLLVSRVPALGSVYEFVGWWRGSCRWVTPVEFLECLESGPRRPVLLWGGNVV